jgi:uncharacterized protein YutE (UPF0331/DUF86 family)
MIDKDKIQNRISIIKENVDELMKMKILSVQDLTLNKRDLAAAKHFLRVGIEAMIDLTTHIVAKKSLGIPANATDALNTLSQNNILPLENVKIYVKMIKYRNRLVHFYHDVTIAEIYDIIQHHLDDFHLFINDILLFLKKENSKG